MAFRASERRVVFLMGAVQFANVLDFVMVMPLGPDFADALGVPTAQLGLVGGMYTVAAALAGIAGVFFLDRFDRRTALLVTLVGFALGTAAGGAAIGFGTLLASRAFAGAFGGPATALALAIVTDVVPPERRGRAIGAVMGASAIATVLGVPLGLELARFAGWRAPFFSVAALGVVAFVCAALLLPPQRAHLDAPTGSASRFRDVLRRPVVVFALSGTAIAMTGHLLVIPNLSAYFQYNRDLPRDQLAVVYLVGGALSFIAMRVSGYTTDRVGAPLAASIGSVLLAAVMIFGFIHPVTWLPVIAVFSGYIAFGTFRYVPIQTLGSRVPLPAERARFMSANSAVQHIASSVGAMTGAAMLTETASKQLVGIENLAWCAVALSLAIPAVVFVTDQMLRRHGPDKS